jgi:hypothetical protein
MKCPQCEMDVEPKYKESIQLSYIAIFILAMITQGYFLFLYVPFRLYSILQTGHHHCPLCNHDFGRATKYFDKYIMRR